MKKWVAALLAAVMFSAIIIFSSAAEQTPKFIITDEAPYTVYTAKNANGDPFPLPLTAKSLFMRVLRADGYSETVVLMQLNEERSALLNENIYRQTLAAYERKASKGQVYIELGGKRYTPVFQEKCPHEAAAAKVIDETYHETACVYCEKSFGHETHKLQNGVCAVCKYRKEFTISVVQPTGGTVKVTPPDKAPAGSTVTVEAIPEPGYVLKEIIVTDESGKELVLNGSDLNLSAGSSGYTFTAPPELLQLR